MTDELTDYTYTVLRYVHDIATGEFVNVGIVLHAPRAKFLRAKVRATYGRLSKVFPDVNGEAFKEALESVERVIEGVSKHLDDLFPAKGETAIEFAMGALVKDDSSLQWSSLGSGRTRNPARQLETLFNSLVLRYERPSAERRKDADVWSDFSRVLQRRQVLAYLQPKEIVSDADRMTFAHAWKNGRWNCVEPISFDLVEGESIHQKATRWVGQMQALSGATKDLKLYLLIGEPRSQAVREEYRRALRILELKMPVEKELVLEVNAEALASKIAEDLKHSLLTPRR
jgi:hypothetical protein